MRVLVYGMVGDHRGGIETFLLKMNKYMSGDTVFDYVIEESSCIHEEEITARGGKIYYINSRHSHPVKNIKDNKRLLKELRGKVGAVYFNLSSLSWIGPIKIAVRMGYRVFVHSHNAEFIKANGSLPYRLVNRMNKKRLHKFNVERLTCSRPATEFMFLSSDKVTMIYNAVDAGGFRYDPQTRSRIRNELGIPEDKLVLGFAGRIQYQKNPLYLCRIIKASDALFPGSELIVAGDGDMKDELMSEVEKCGLKDRVFFLGKITNVNEVMQAMDALLLPSFHEGLPYVMIEAQAAGLPCFAADTITAEAKITDNVFYLPLTESAENWAETIHKYFAGGKRDREKCYDIVAESSFNIKTEAKRLERLLSGDNAR